MNRLFIRQGSRWALLVLCGVVAVAAAGGCNSSTPQAPSPTQPTATISSPAPSQQPLPPTPGVSGQVAVKIADLQTYPNCFSCFPLLPERVSLDGGRVQAFNNSGWLVWTDVPDGVHTLRILGGEYGYAAVCGFYFNDEWQQVLDIAMTNGQSTLVAIRFDCG